MKGPSNTRNRIHSLQLPLHPLPKAGWSDEIQGGSKLNADYPAKGVNFACRNTLGEREELERQTVYFSPPEYLNDPMEGLRQVYWRGDRIVWRNLLRHYIICLHNRYFEAHLTVSAIFDAP
jgi:hypothetical protein